MQSSDMLRVAAVLALAAVAGGAARADWPHWRGDGGNGLSLTSKPPVEFGLERNLRWKAVIPGRGSSSSVVVGNRVFVTTALRAEGEAELLDFRLLCFDRETGREAWSQSCVKAVPHEGTHETNGFASASPCTDGERVYAHFGSRGLHCFTLEGKHLWSRDFGDMTVRHGFGE
jgi:outer membrane protein assembly factor BamB